MKKNISTILFITVLVILIILAVFFAFGNKNKEKIINENLSLTEISETDNYKGNKEAENILIEYSDFQCPACAFFYPVVSQLSEEMGDDLVIVYRNFPLRQIHDKAQLAGQAAEAAGKQGKFWEMHDILFEEQNLWSKMNLKEAEEYFTDLAGRINLDLNKFNADLKSDEIIEKVNNDFISGRGFDVRGTPTFFINGERVENFSSYEKFKEEIVKRMK